MGKRQLLGPGQLYGMSIWGGGWGVAGPDNVRAEPGKLLEPEIVPNGKDAKNQSQEVPLHCENYLLNYA